MNDSESIQIEGQEYLVLRRERETEGPRAGKADAIYLRKPNGRVVFMTWDWGVSRAKRFEPPFKIGDDFQTFF